MPLTLIAREYQAYVCHVQHFYMPSGEFYVVSSLRYLLGLYNFFFKFLFYFTLCMSVLPTFIYEYHVFARCLNRTGEGITVLATGVTDGSELPYVCWELNLGCLQDQQMLVTTEKISSSPPL